MFYVARRWVLTNLYFHVCHWIASHFFPLYSWKLSRVPSKLHNGKIWLIDPPQPQSLPYQTEQLQMHFITQTWAFLFTNLSTLIDICLHCLAWSYCASFTAQAPPQPSGTYTFLFLLSALHLPLTNQSRELHLLHFSLLRWHLDLPLPSDLTMTVSLSFYPFVDSFTWRLFLRLKRKVIDNDWMLHRFILLLDQHYPMQKLSQQSLKCWYQTKTV